MADSFVLDDAGKALVALVGIVPPLPVDAFAAMVAKSEAPYSKEGCYKLCLSCVAAGFLKVILSEKGTPQFSLTSKGENASNAD